MERWANMGLLEKISFIYIYIYPSEIRMVDLLNVQNGG